MRALTRKARPILSLTLLVLGLSFTGLPAEMPDRGLQSQAALAAGMRGGTSLVVAPNPFFGDRHSQVDFRISATVGMSVSIDLFTMGMEKVRTLYSDGPFAAEGIEILSWNLTNEDGRYVAPGMYLALARFEAGGERFTETHRVMLVF